MLFPCKKKVDSSHSLLMFLNDKNKYYQVNQGKWVSSKATQSHLVKVNLFQLNHVRHKALYMKQQDKTNKTSMNTYISLNKKTLTIVHFTVDGHLIYISQKFFSWCVFLLPYILMRVEKKCKVKLKRKKMNQKLFFQMFTWWKHIKEFSL